MQPCISINFLIFEMWFPTYYYHRPYVVHRWEYMLFWKLHTLSLSKPKKNYMLSRKENNMHREIGQGG